MPEQSDQTTPRVLAPPPVLFLAAVLIGIEADNLAPAAFLPDALQYAAGGILVAAALGLAGWAIGLFRRVGTEVPTWKPSTALVTGGPYRFTRNPIYLALVLLTLGIGALVDSLWFVPAAILLVIALDRGVIAREERYLAGRFGTPYEDFRRRVRRWI